MECQQPPYPFYTARGDARELGRQHGVQAGALIRAFLELLETSLNFTPSELERRALKFLPLFEAHCPHLIPEIEGLAEGAGIRFPTALALQLRGELACLREGLCTSFVISPRGTSNREILIGQNSDTIPEIERLGYVLRLFPEDRPPMLMWTFGGMLGYHGLNAAGVAHFANSLGGGPAWKMGLSHYPIKRLMLECRSLAKVREILHAAPVCSNGNYVLCDGSGQIADVELTSDGPYELEDQGAGFFAHANHYVCSLHACPANFAQSLADSFPRLDRLQTLIGEKFGTLTVADLKSFLADHAGFPVGICRHPHDGSDDPVLPRTGKTVAALIAEPARGVLHISRGNPCTKPWTSYALDEPLSSV
jgi:isopenicillin-N N-acyltransferase-like protein